MNIPDDLRMQICSTDSSLERCVSVIQDLVHEREALRARVLDLESIARQCERELHGRSHAVPFRIEIEGIDGNIRCLDEQITLQEKTAKRLEDGRTYAVVLYLMQHDLRYTALLETVQKQRNILARARDTCKDFLIIVDCAVEKVIASQHTGYIYGQAFLAVVDPAEVRKGIGITNTAIDYFNRDFDFGLVLTPGIRLSSVRVPYCGPTMEYLCEAKRQVLLRRGVVGRFHDTITKMIDGVFDLATTYVNNVINQARTLDLPYR